MATMNKVRGGEGYEEIKVSSDGIVDLRLGKVDEKDKKMREMQVQIDKLMKELAALKLDKSKGKKRKATADATPDSGSNKKAKKDEGKAPVAKGKGKGKAKASK